MKNVLDALLALIFTVTTGIAGAKLYTFVKTEALTNVQRGLPAMEPFARRLVR